MAYINFQNCTKEEYEQIIYSQNSINKIKIIFDDTELLDADRYCEKVTMVSRILPTDVSKRFSLDNFVSKEITITLHDIDLSIIKSPVNVLIGTLVDSANNTYEYVPLGIFNIQDTPTNDNNKTTITLRDNRVKFDFGYNAKPLIDTHGGTATKMQILNDICTQAGVVSDVTTFLGENDEIGIYDNSITANVYVSYIAEQAGMMPTITRDGHLQFINVNNSTVWKIPLYLLEKYEIGKKYKIERVVYESGILKYETSSDKTLDTLYINSANPYIVNQQHINDIYSNVSNFEIDSLETGKILGNPAIDPYDIIEVYGYYEILPNGNKQFIDDDTVIVARTLANCNFTYRKTMIAEYSTVIGEEERKENNTISGEATYRKYAKTEYDELNGSINIVAGQVDEQNSKIAQMQITVDEINQKIGEVTDITVSAEDTDGEVQLEGINESEPIQIKIHPIVSNISLLYPYSGLYPSSTLYPKSRILRFTRTYTEEGVQKTQIIDYELPYDLLYYDQDTYDEFYLDYDSQTCYVIKRCAYNSSGNVIELENEQVINIDPYPTIILGDGNYTVELLGYNQAYLYVRLMASNIYTTQFATKVELSTQIKQTAKSISITATDNNTSAGINIKLYNEDGTVLDDEDANITMSGKVAFTDLSSSNPTRTIINGDNITTGIIKSSNYIANTSGTAINLTNGTIDTKDFKVSSTGNITSTGGTIGGWEIENNGLKKAFGNNERYVFEIRTDRASNIACMGVWDNQTQSSNFYVTPEGYLYAKNGNISGGMITETVSGASINLYNGTGFLKMSLGDSNNPFVSALNVALGSGGISFRNSGDRYNVGSQLGHIYASSAGNVVIEGNTGTWIQDINIQTNYIMNCYQLSGIDDTYLRLNYSVVLKPNPYGGAYIWGTEDYNKILTVGGSPSTLSIKENVVKKDTSDIPKMLNQIELYDYKYIDEINNGENDYGYIIDYLEKINGIDKYFVFNEIERNGLKYKTINHEHLSKFLLGAVIELQKEINSLKEEKYE